jgi:hypothetical protein
MSDNLEPHVFKMRAIIQPLGGRWWRNPIYWWKMRHLRADLRYYEETQTEVGKALANKFEEKMEEQFLFGTGEREGP